jgi:hypothetical protein
MFILYVNDIHGDTHFHIMPVYKLSEHLYLQTSPHDSVKNIEEKILVDKISTNIIFN